MRRPKAALGSLLLLISCLACEPIPSPATESADPLFARLEPGDQLPQFLLTDRQGNTVTPATLLGRVSTLTFVVPGAAQPESFLRRVDDVYDRLGADAARGRRYLVTLPSPAIESPIAERDGWESLSGDAEIVAELAARFGVLSWSGSNGIPAQTLGVAVVAPDGLIAAIFGGLETWEEMDLLVAITQADR